MGLVTGRKNIRISRTSLKKGKHGAVCTHAITIQEERIQRQLSLRLAVDKGLRSHSLPSLVNPS
jgi:hypothetical protein